MCLLLSLAILLTGSVSVFAADSEGTAGSEQRAEAARSVRFSDTAGHWAAEYIGEGVEKSWINGYPNGTFRPQNTITRAEFVKLILSAMKLTPGSENAKYLDALELMTKDDKPYDVTPLSDVKAHWVTTGGYMDIALKYGMVINAEYSGEKFQPDKAITRREIAVMAMRAGTGLSVERYGRKIELHRRGGLSGLAAGISDDDRKDRSHRRLSGRILPWRKHGNPSGGADDCFTCDGRDGTEHR